jgi:hypothetical protein
LFRIYSGKKTYQRGADGFQILHWYIRKYAEQFSCNVTFSLNANLFRRQKNHAKEL